MKPAVNRNGGAESPYMQGNQAYMKDNSKEWRKFQMNNNKKKTSSNPRRDATDSYSGSNHQSLGYGLKIASKPKGSGTAASDSLLVPRGPTKASNDGVVASRQEKTLGLRLIISAFMSVGGTILKMLGLTSSRESGGLGESEKQNNYQQNLKNLAELIGTQHSSCIRAPGDHGKVNNFSGSVLGDKVIDFRKLLNSGEISGSDIFAIYKSSVKEIIPTETLMQVFNPENGLDTPESKLEFLKNTLGATKTKKINNYLNAIGQSILATEKGEAKDLTAGENQYTHYYLPETGELSDNCTKAMITPVLVGGDFADRLLASRGHKKAEVGNIGWIDLTQKVNSELSDFLSLWGRSCYDELKA